MEATLRRRTSGYAMVAVAASSWGTWPLILRIAERYGPVPTALQSAIVMGAMTLVSTPAALRTRLPRAPLRDWVLLGLTGLFDALNVLTFFAAYRTTTVAVAVLTHYLAPVLVAGLAPWLLGEQARARTYGAIALSLGGLVLLLGPWRAQGPLAGGVGALLGATSALFYALNVLVSKHLAQRFGGAQIMSFHMVVALPVLVLATPSGAIGALTAPSALVLLAAGVGPGAAAGLLFLTGLRRIPASHASTLTLLEPLVAVLLGATVFAESVGVAALVGAAGILAGAALVVSARSLPEPSGA